MCKMECIDKKVILVPFKGKFIFSELFTFCLSVLKESSTGPVVKECHRIAILLRFSGA